MRKEHGIRGRHGPLLGISYACGSALPRDRPPARQLSRQQQPFLGHDQGRSGRERPATAFLATRGSNSPTRSFPLGCTQCHGGDPDALTKEAAHIQAKAPLPKDATVLPRDYFDLPYLRFVNPTNLRVLPTTCGQAGYGGVSCHAGYAQDVEKSMMATTAGHLAGGAYQNGLLPDRRAIWGNMPVQDLDGNVPTARGALPSLVQVPAEITSFPARLVPASLQRRAAQDLRAVPPLVARQSGAGRSGARGQLPLGGLRGLPHAVHERRCERVAGPDAQPVRGRTPSHPSADDEDPTHQCGHCHTRGARIGLSYQGLAQLPPATATGPAYAGLTPQKIYGAYHVQNPAVNPPDIHFERGMHCIDCHVRVESMGDGNIYGHMDQAVQIECEDCHGTPDAYGTMVTGRGVRHTHLRWQNGRMILTGKVDGKEHVVPQVKDIVDPGHASYNAVAATAMNANHLKAAGGLECYACHSTWQNNCYGCHFNRDLGKTALDMIAGVATQGKPETGNKYFLNFKNFHMGYNAEGKVAPFVTGCQALATVTDSMGTKILDQETPVTAGGRSGLSLNPVQPHTVRDTPRSCDECHRNPSSLGLGTESFNLLRRYLFALNPAPTGKLMVLDRRTTSIPSVAGVLGLNDPARLVRSDRSDHRQGRRGPRHRRCRRAGHSGSR